MNKCLLGTVQSFCGKHKQSRRAWCSTWHLKWCLNWHSVPAPEIDGVMFDNAFVNEKLSTKKTIIIFSLPFFQRVLAHFYFCRKYVIKFLFRRVNARENLHKKLFGGIGEKLVYCREIFRQNAWILHGFYGEFIRWWKINGKLFCVVAKCDMLEQYHFSWIYNLILWGLGEFAGFLMVFMVFTEDVLTLHFKFYSLKCVFFWKMILEQQRKFM